MVIILGLLLSGCQMEKESTKIGNLIAGSQPIEEDSAKPPIEQIYEVGDIISINDTILIVLGWDNPPGGDFNPPAEGKKYLVVDLMLANQSESIGLNFS